jgi:hypothetical protein
MAKHVIWKRADGDADLTDLRALLESVRSIVEAHADDELSDDEREAMLRATFDEYEEFTGRDGLADIAATRGETKDKEPEMDTIDKGAVALIALHGVAEMLRKREPELELSEEQWFSRACDERPDILKIERQASRSGTPWSRVDPEILDDLSDAKVRELADEERRRNPFLTPEQAFARIYTSPALTRERNARRKAEAASRREATDRISQARLDFGGSLEVAKRDDAHDAITAQAHELRKIMPNLTFEQAYEKVYTDSANRQLAKAERGAACAALYA